MLPKSLETECGNPRFPPAVLLGVEDPVPTEYPKVSEEDADGEELANLYIMFTTNMRVTRPEILRGVRASEVLRHLPWVWLRRDLTSLYPLSHEAAKFDQFWSHSWKGALWAKYVNIFYLQTCLPANIVGIISASVACVLVSEGLLEARKGWCLLLGFAGFCVTPLLWRSGKVVFLDMACINQRDQGLKGEAIISMGAFLKQSDSMLVLWDPTWVTRL